VAHIWDGEEEVARLPVELVTEAPQYTRDGVPPAEMAGLQAFDLDSLPDVVDANAALLRLLAAPTIASKLWIHRQYDQSVLTNTVAEAGDAAAVMRVRGSRKGVAFCTDGNGRYCYLDPFAGGAMAVAEAARNVVCVGARPVAITDCLNFGNPERPEVYYQMQQVIGGMAAACEKLGIPVISGNVSLFNETGGEAIYPTPVIGMLGLLEDVTRRCSLTFAREGHEVLLLGGTVSSGAEALAGSEYLKEMHDTVAGRPGIDLELEERLQRAALAATDEGLVAAAHDCAEGGLAVALAEMCFAAGVGLDARDARFDGRIDAALFGEAPSRIVLAVPVGSRQRLAQIAHDHDVPLVAIGRLGGQGFILGRHIDLPLTELARAHGGGLERALGG
jgi:phosphoribosylformylglycinamidine synthase